MSMGIGINDEQPDDGVLRGREEDVACGVWFTSTGATMPKIIKFRDSAGEIHTLQGIRVLTTERKNYCGISTIEYACDTVIGACRQPFLLLYYIERQEWKICWREPEAMAQARKVSENPKEIKVGKPLNLYYYE